MINHKIDFVFTIEVSGANPNGDPLNGNMPRMDSKGYGEISDVCIKRKIRNRMQDLGAKIFVQSQERCDDGCDSLLTRFQNMKGSEKAKDVEQLANQTWLDVRSFGQVFTEKKNSLAIRGPVTISMGKSIDVINPISMQITKSVNSMPVPETSTSGRSSDTMGTKHYIDYGIYVVNGSINSYFAEKTGLNEDDVAMIKQCLQTLFVNDASSARPDGSMQVKDLFWFIHSSKAGDVSSAKIKDLLEYEIPYDQLGRLKYEDYHIRLNPDKLKEYEDKGLTLEHLQGE